jgi:phage tail-like protein
MPEERTVLGGAPDVLSTDAQGQGIKYPIRGHRFVVNLEGLGLMSFKTVSGCTIDMNKTEYREGAFATLVSRQVPGLLNTQDITLEKGMYNATTLYDYFMGYVNGKTTSVAQMYIDAYDNADQVIAKWTAINVWPFHYETGQLDASSAEILVENVQFATEGIYRLPV